MNSTFIGSISGLLLVAKKLVCSGALRSVTSGACTNSKTSTRYQTRPCIGCERSSMTRLVARERAKQRKPAMLAAELNAVVTLVAVDVANEF
jgi:hypothetical protein